MNLTKRQSIAFALGSLVFIFALSYGATISKLSYLVYVPSALVAWGTLMLAVATFQLVSSNIERDKRVRKEQLLKEISQWAEDSLEMVNKFSRGFRDTELYDVKEILLVRKISIANISTGMGKNFSEVSDRALRALEVFEEETRKENWHLEDKVRQCDKTLKELLKSIAIMRLDSVDDRFRIKSQEMSRHKRHKMKNSWSTMEKVILALLLVIAIGSIGVLIGLVFVPPDKPTQLGTLSQGLATLGVLATAFIMWMSARELRHQAEQQRYQWEREQEAMSRPLIAYSRAWFSGPEQDLSLNIVLVNTGRSFTGLRSFLLLTDSTFARAQWAKGQYPGGSTTSGTTVNLATEEATGGRQKDVEFGEDIQFIFGAHSILGEGSQFTLVLEYWDLEGRAYRAAWGFMTQGQDSEGLWVDFRDQMPAQRVPDKDRI